MFDHISTHFWVINTAVSLLLKVCAIGFHVAVESYGLDAVVTEDGYTSYDMDIVSTDLHQTKSLT